MASEPVNVNEFQELARKVLPKMYYDFYNGGAEDQYTLEQNIEAFRRITYVFRLNYMVLNRLTCLSVVLFLTH